jgi:hypothetical protein
VKVTTNVHLMLRSRMVELCIHCPICLHAEALIQSYSAFTVSLGRAIAEAVSRWPGFPHGSGKWDLWWTKWRRGRFSPSTSVSPAKTIHSTNFSIFSITRGRYNRPVVAAVASGPSMDSTPPPNVKKKYRYFIHAQ